MKKIFIIVLLFCFIGIEIKAEEVINDSSYYIDEIVEYNLMDSEKFEIIQRYSNRVRDFGNIGNNDIIYNGDDLNNFIEYNDEYVDSSQNIIVLLVILIIIGVLYLIIFDKNE